MTGPLPPAYSVVIPAYNEERRLPRALHELADYGLKRGAPFEIIPVIECSRDHTLDRALEIARRHDSIRVVENPIHKGKGYAVRTGVHRARGDLVFVMDADLSVPVDHIGCFLDRFAADPSVDVLIGSRQHEGSRIGRYQSWPRRSMGKAFNRCARLLGLTRLPDTQCGFKAYRREAARAIFERQVVDGFACDLEALLLAERMGLRVEELPVHWTNSPDSRVRLFSDSLDMLLDLLRLRRLTGRTLKERPFNRERQPAPERAETIV